jgi:hypothetical protein
METSHRSVGSEKDVVFALALARLIPAERPTPSYESSRPWHAEVWNLLDSAAAGRYSLAGARHTPGGIMTGFFGIEPDEYMALHGMIYGVAGWDADPVEKFKRIAHSEHPAIPLRSSFYPER